MHGEKLHPREKAALGAAFSVFESRLKGAESFYYPLLLGYQVRHLEPPKYFEGIVVEVVISQRSLLRFLGAPLDKFSTFGGWGCKLLKVRGGRRQERGDRRQETGDLRSCGKAGSRPFKRDAGAEAHFYRRGLRHDRGRALIQNQVFRQAVEAVPNASSGPKGPFFSSSGSPA